jgi:ABC-type dipeptide/oligopeptide/nickel transport system ATPase component
MKLTELQSNDYVKLLLLGESGAGKTVLATSFPTPIKVYDFDQKISSAAKFYAKDTDRLSSIDVEQYGKLPIKERMQKFLASVREIENLQHAGKPLPFKTLVIDSLTTLTNAILEDYKKVSQLGIKRALADVNAMQDYQLLQIHLTQLITGILSLDCNVVVIGHTQLEKDETTGMMRNTILMPGQLAFKLPIFFEEVYLAKINAKGERVLQTQSDSKTSLRSQRQLPVEIPSNYTSIVGAK